MIQESEVIKFLLMLTQISNSIFKTNYLEEPIALSSEVIYYAIYTESHQGLRNCYKIEVVVMFSIS